MSALCRANIDWAKVCYSNIMAIFNLIFICHTIIRSHQYKILHIVLLRMLLHCKLIIIAASGNNLCTHLYSWVVTQPRFESSKQLHISKCLFLNALVFISALSFHCFHSKVGKFHDQVLSILDLPWRQNQKSLFYSTHTKVKSCFTKQKIDLVIWNFFIKFYSASRLFLKVLFCM